MPWKAKAESASKISEADPLKKEIEELRKRDAERLWGSDEHLGFVICVRLSGPDDWCTCGLDRTSPERAAAVYN